MNMLVYTNLSQTQSIFFPYTSHMTTPHEVTKFCVKSMTKIDNGLFCKCISAFSS